MKTTMAISAALFVSLALAGASAAQSDASGQMSTGGMSSHDNMSSGSMSTGGMSSHDSMSAGSMSSHDAMPSDSMSSGDHMAMKKHKVKKTHQAAMSTTPMSH
jgi:pentapeptide MXKDX repeat protein